MRNPGKLLLVATALLAVAVTTGHADGIPAPDPAAALESSSEPSGESAAGSTAALASSTSTVSGGPSVPEDETKLIYVANRTPETIFDSPRAVVVLTADEIRRRNARNLPELLMQEAGIFVQQTNYGGGAPIIRGLIGKQILILIDGIRLNSATYRFGPVQYLNTIDLHMIERIEIVRGVVSVLGSDSAGGAINIVTRKGPGPRGQGLGGAAFTRFSSADQAFRGHGEVSGRGRSHRFLAGATYQTSDDVTAGGDIGTQGATGYDEGAANLSFDYFVGPARTLSLGYQFLQQNGVPRTDRVLGGRNLVFDFDPQRRQLLTTTYEDFETGLRVAGYWNRQDEGRREIRSSASSVERSLFDRQDAFGVNVDKDLYLASNYLVFGLDYAWETIQSRRTDRNLLTGEERVRRGNWTDGATYQTFAVYARDRIDVGRWLSLTVGGRYGHFSSDGLESSGLGEFALTGSQDALTGTVNLAFHVTEQLNLIGNVTRGFRAANLDDISVYDEREEGTEIPNPDVEPERIWSYELGAKFDNGRLFASAFVFGSDLSQLLLRAPGTYMGLPFLDLNGNGIQDSGEPNVLQRLNVGESRIRGLEAEAHWKVLPTLSLFGHVTYTEGDDMTADTPLPRIPPTFGAAGFRWFGRSERKPWAEAAYLFAGAQTRLSPSDIRDSRIGPDGTPGYNVVNLRGGLSFGSLDLSLAVENLFDEEYKYHASGVHRPGIQIVVGAGYGF